MKPSQGRVSLSDKLRSNARSEAMYAALGGVLVRPDITESIAELEAAEERKLAKGPRKPNARPEGIAQDAILEYLKAHLNVRAVSRINRGALQGEDTFVRFNTTFGKQNGMYMRIGDLQAVHWPSGRLIAIEVKAPGWKRPSGTREHEQAAYLECVREAGGLAIFATSVDEVRRLLEEA